jgi:hypothetical protein
MTRTVDVEYWLGDNDFGTMFYNYWLHEDLQSQSGVDVTQLFPEELEERRASLALMDTSCCGIKTLP